MGRNSSRDSLRSLLRAMQRFQKWRRTKRGCERIPRALWSVAVKVAAQHGVNKTAQASGLNHNALKAELEKQSEGTVSNEHSSSGFVALPLPALSSVPECVVEVENSKGQKLRIHFKGVATADVLSVSRALWDDQR